MQVIQFRLVQIQPLICYPPPYYPKFRALHLFSALPLGKAIWGEGH